ncbi:MAG TPA: hypothetical protein VMW43_07295 [Bacteroidota bacterium]|nr:hypothetical protein [Bacteroidota bacterium]
MALVLFPHHPIDLEGVFNRAIQILLLILSVLIYRSEPNPKNKFIFLNFIFLFTVSVSHYFFDFVGVSIFTENKFATHILHQYTLIGFQVFMSLAICYIVIDQIFRELRIYQKYLAAIALSVIVSWMIFQPYFHDPLYLYSTQDIKQFKTLYQAVDPAKETPSAIQLAGSVKLQSWEDGRAVGDLYPDQNIRRIEYLMPYLAGNNYIILLWKPMNMSIVYMNVFFIVFILLFFLYQFKKDPPQGAYIDKIMFLFLLLSSMEILHNWGFSHSVEFSSFADLFAVSQYVTIFVEFFIVWFFVLRLRFITSVQGEFYELELASNPQTISRWRDWVDNLILERFFNFKLFNGRLFQNSQGK